jgi:glycosyltransferase involved in cell wall biosynthesis
VVLAELRKADLFAAASRIAADGDRDGLPNVLMEAQSQALPVVASRVAAIPELIADGETGLLVPPDDCGALASALLRLIDDPGLRRRLGAAGERRVRAAFDCAPWLDRLAARFAMHRRPHDARAA